MSKQSNEVNEAADQRDPTTRGLTRRDRQRPNRDAFIEAKDHAENVLALDEKVSDGVRQSLRRFANSPLTLMMEILNDDEHPWERREAAAHRIFPYLHRKLEDQHGQASGGGAGGGGSNGPGGPTINLTVQRPQVTINEREAPAPAPAGRSADVPPNAGAGTTRAVPPGKRVKAGKRPQKVKA